MTNHNDEVGDDDIGCIEAINGLYAYLDGEIDDRKSIEAIESHLSHCKHCFSRIELERALSERLKKSGLGKPPERLKNRLRDLMDKFDDEE